MILKQEVHDIRMRRIQIFQYNLLIYLKYIEDDTNKFKILCKLIGKTSCMSKSLKTMITP